MLAVKIKGTNDRPTLDLVEPTHGDNVTVVTDDKTGEVKFDITEKADVANDTTVSGTLKSDDDDRGATCATAWRSASRTWSPKRAETSPSIPVPTASPAWANRSIRLLTARSRLKARTAR